MLGYTLQRLLQNLTRLVYTWIEYNVVSATHTQHVTASCPVLYDNFTKKMTTQVVQYMQHTLQVTVLQSTYDNAGHTWMRRTTPLTACMRFQQAFDGKTGR